jgi:hypothetical protein
VEASHSGIAPQRKPSADTAYEAAGAGPAAERSPRAKASRRITPDGLHAGLGEEVRNRLTLQRRARETLRHHIQRAAVRFTVLASADLGAFYAMRLLLRLVRDGAILGPALARELGSLMPKGALTGFQFPLAMFLCLLAAGTYGQGDLRRSPARILIASALAVALPLN